MPIKLFKHFLYDFNSQSEQGNDFFFKCKAILMSSDGFRSTNRWLFQLIFFILLQMNQLSFAQENASVVYFAPRISVASMMSQTAIITGAKGGWMITKSFAIGGSFAKLSNDIPFNWTDPINGKKPVLDFSYGGLFFEYSIETFSKIALTIEMLFAGGGVNLMPVDKSANYSDFYGGDILVWEPHLGVNYSLGSHIQIQLGMSYMAISGLEKFINNNRPELPHFAIKDLQSITGSLAVRFIFF